MSNAHCQILGKSSWASVPIVLLKTVVGIENEVQRFKMKWKRGKGVPIYSLYGVIYATFSLGARPTGRQTRPACGEHWDAPQPGKDFLVSDQQVPVRDGTKVGVRFYKPIKPVSDVVLVLKAHGGGETCSVVPPNHGPLTAKHRLGRWRPWGRGDRESHTSCTRQCSCRQC